MTGTQPAISMLAEPQTALIAVTKTNTFVFALDQFTEAGRALLLYAEQHPVQFALFSLMIVAGLVTIIVPLAMGFSAAGPVAGELLCPYCTSCSFR